MKPNKIIQIQLSPENEFNNMYIVALDIDGNLWETYRNEEGYWNPWIEIVPKEIQK